jgi:hypothetical protein
MVLSLMRERRRNLLLLSVRRVRLLVLLLKVLLRDGRNRRVERGVVLLREPVAVRSRVRVKEGLDVGRRRGEAELAIRARLLPELRI